MQGPPYSPGRNSLMTVDKEAGSSSGIRSCRVLCCPAGRPINAVLADGILARGCPRPPSGPIGYASHCLPLPAPADRTAGPTGWTAIHGKGLSEIPAIRVPALCRRDQDIAGVFPQVRTPVEEPVVARLLHRSLSKSLPGVDSGEGKEPLPCPGYMTPAFMTDGEPQRIYGHQQPRTHVSRGCLPGGCIDPQSSGTCRMTYNPSSADPGKPGFQLQQKYSYL